MGKRKLAVAFLKALAGLVLLTAAFEYPRTVTALLLFVFIALLVAHFMFGSVHYIGWNNLKPRLVSYRRLDHAPKYVIPKSSILGQAIRLLLHLLGHGLVLASVVVATLGAMVYFDVPMGRAWDNRYELTAAELHDLEQPGISLNAGAYLSSASELSAAEREMLKQVGARPFGGDQTPLGANVFPVNRTALTARVVTFAFADGRTIRFVGAPVANFPNKAWTGKSREHAGLMLDETPQGLVGEIRHEGRSYTMHTVGPGGSRMLVRPVHPEAFYEPPDMSGHPPFPRGVR